MAADADGVVAARDLERFAAVAGDVSIDVDAVLLGPGGEDDVAAV